MILQVLIIKIIPTDYNLVVSTTNSNFSIVIEKPRSASSITMLPVRSFYIGNMFIKQNLIVRIPCINVYNNGFVQSIPYVYTNEQWKEILLFA